MRVQSLGLEDALEEGMATHSSILAWRIPWMEKPGGLQSMGSQRVRISAPRGPRDPNRLQERMPPMERQTHT